MYITGKLRNASFRLTLAKNPTMLLIRKFHGKSFQLVGISIEVLHRILPKTKLLK